MRLKIPCTIRLPLLGALTLLGLGSAHAQGDFCAAAVNLTVSGNYAANGPNTGAGASNVCFGGGATNADWYKFTAFDNGTATVASCNDIGAIDSRLSIYTGTCAALTCLTSSDDACGTGTTFSSTATFAVTAGTTYFIEWDDRWSGNSFTWDLTVPAAPPVFAAETCANAQAILLPGFYSADGPSTGSGQEPFCFGIGGSGHADWYKWTAPNNGTAIVTSCADIGDVDSRLSIGTGTCGSLSCVASNDDFCNTSGFSSQAQFAVTQGQTYYFQWDDRWSTAAFDWELQFVPIFCTSPAASVSVVEDCANGLYSANVDVTSFGSGASADISYTINGGAPVVVTANVLGIVVLGPFASGDVLNVNLQHESDNSCDVSLGNYVDCCYSTCGAAAVASVGVNFCPRVNCGGGASNLGAPGATNARWFTYTPAASGQINVSSCGSSQDTRVSVHDGTCLALNNLGINDDAPCGGFSLQSDLQGINVTAGTTYYIEWDDRWAQSTGFNWTLDFIACQPPVASVTVVENCGGGNFSLDVNVSSFGSGLSADVEYSVNAGIPVSVTTSVLGVVTIGPFASGAEVDVNVLHDSDTDCDVALGSYTDCCSGSCVNALPAVVGVNFCPSLDCGNGASNLGSTFATNARWFSFTPPSTGQISVDNCGTFIFGGLTIHDATPGCGALGPVLGYSTFGPCGDGAELANIPVVGGTTYLIEWDDSWTSNGNFNWNLSYISCTPPTATADAIDNCGASTFTVDVNVTALGSSTSFDIVAVPGGVLATGVGLGITTVGPFPSGSPVQFTLVNTTDPNCFIDLGAFQGCCSGSCSNALPAVVGINSNGPIDCGGTATNALAGGAVNARWWTYTAPGYGILAINSCDPVNTTNPDTRVTVHTGTCGALTFIGGDDDGCSTPIFGSSYTGLVSPGQNLFIEWDDRWNQSAHDWELAFTPCTPPANDLCVNQVPTATSLAPGGSANFAMDVNCTSDDVGLASLFPPFQGVTGYGWISFELTSCADVKVDYCGTVGPWTTVSLNMYADCGGTNAINSQTFNTSSCLGGYPSVFYNSLPPGVYYYPVLSGAGWSNNVFNLNVTANAPVIPCTPNQCIEADTLVCGVPVVGTTVSNSATQGPSVCLPNFTAPGPDAWYTFIEGPTSQLLTASTCFGTSYNSMLTVYAAAPDCSNLICLTGNDDGCGTADGASEINWISTPNTKYYIAVHGPSGFVNSTGTYTLIVTCSAPCTPQSNDDCANAASLTPVFGDGNGIPATGDNSCSFADPNPSCSIDFGFVPNAFKAQGVWYTFNSGVNTSMKLTLLDVDEDPAYTSTALSYVLYEGTCGNLTEVACVTAGEGITDLPTLTPATNYTLMVYNNGGIGLEGTFGILLEYPAQNDAAVVSIDAPVGNVCSTTIVPSITIANNGQQTLTSLTIAYDVDNGTPVVFGWTGNLVYGASEVVVLPSSIVGNGPHTLNVSTSLPNGVADELPGDDALSGAFTVAGEGVELVLDLDQFPSETTWEIYDAFFLVVANGGPYAFGQANTQVVENLCLSIDFGSCYSLYIYDSFGDGMCCSFGLGSWAVRNPNGGTLLSDVFHGSGLSPDGLPDPGVVNTTPTPTPASPSYLAHSFCLPGGPANIEAGECGVFTNTLQSKVYCNAVAGVSSYQFEFSDPDAGFNRRIAVSGRNWVKFGEMVTTPLQPGTYYFTRVRADQNAPGFSDDQFGAGCETGIDPNQVPGCTQLIDDIGLPTHSCNTTKLFGAGDKIYALPILNGTQYRFRFENAGEGFLRVISRPNYICLLNWTTLPLQTGVTYSVTVEVLVNGQWSGYCGNACNLTIGAPPAQGSQAREIAATENSDLQIWPNPVRDGQVNILLSDIAEQEQTITIDVIDLFGKRVHAKQFNNSGEQFNTVLDLDGLAAGVYVVTITVNDRIMTERITVQ